MSRNLISGVYARAETFYKMPLSRPRGVATIVPRTKEPESAEHLCGKCVEYAKAWKPVADKLWAQTDYHPHKYENWAGFNQKDAPEAEASRN